MVALRVLFMFTWLYCSFDSCINGLTISNVNNRRVLVENDRNRYNPFARKYFQERLPRNNTNPNPNENYKIIVRRYPITRPDYIEELRRLNSKNVTIQTNSILGSENQFYNETDNTENDTNTTDNRVPRLRIILNKSNILESLGIELDADSSSLFLFSLYN